jgi:N-acetyl-anhydromuramyl-L-alanine amidase AmpD
MNIQFKQTPNYTPGNTKKSVVVLHFTLGAYNGAVSWLSNANRPNRSSSHFVIGRNEGEIIVPSHEKRAEAFYAIES